MNKIEFYTTECGDWTAVYLDGEWCDEGHSIQARELVDMLLGEDLTSTIALSFTVIDEWASENSFPLNSKDIPLTALYH